jgi:tRNA threonylcarbamoyladenosine biosynthesis protein TsaB
VTVRLALDAATDRLSVAGDRGGGAAVEHSLVGARSHAGALLGLVDQVLQELAATRRDISLVAVADGPGSFTGLRVSFAAAKAIVGDRLPLVTAPSLLLRAAADADPGERVLAIAGALRGEVYAGAWRLDLPNSIETLLAPRTVGRSDLSDLPAVDRVVGDGPAEIIGALGQVTPVFPSGAVLLGLIGVPGGPSAVAHPLSFEPSYGRPAEAQAKWERDHGRALPDPSR